MRRLILLPGAVLMCMVSVAYGQTLPKLTGKPQPVVKGANLKVYPPTDLAVSSFSLHSITKDNSRGAYVVTVSVTVHNNGGIASSALTTLKCYYADASHMVKPPSNKPPGANDHWAMTPWTWCAAEPKLPILTEGQSWSGELTFEVLLQDVENRKFYMIMMADYYNNSRESNENNNYSSLLFITPPAH